jgi:CBS domain containing-hemolysin-like protein
MGLLILYVAIALGFSFLCSLLEASLLTITNTQLQAAKSKGKRWSGRLQQLKQDIDKPLAAILTLNTIAHTMGATGAGAQYAKVYGDATGGIFAGVLTLAVLIFTEIIPKTLGARYAGFFAPFTAAVLPFLQTVLRPIVYVCQLITQLMTFGRTAEAPKHREELLAVARLGEVEGTIKADESRIVRNMLELHRINAAAIMTPRPVVYMLPEATTLEEFVEHMAKTQFSRIPVYGENSELVSGFVLRSDVLQACLAQPDQTLSSLKREIAFVPNIMKVDDLIQRMLNEKLHIAMVQDEFGSTVGLVTLEDALETLMGVEIMDEHDRVTDLQAHARKIWRRRAREMGIDTGEEQGAG